METRMSTHPLWDDERAVETPEYKDTSRLSPREHAVHYSIISGHAQVHLGDNHGPSNSGSGSDRQKCLSRLNFPHMNARSQQISSSFPRTYEWILQSSSEACPSWNCFVSWLSQPKQIFGAYWIYGKPGSGKSTIMKYLDSKIITSGHLMPWAEQSSIFKASYYFWSAGNPLQRSLEGFCRYLLVQILEQYSDMVDLVVSGCKGLELGLDRNTFNRKQLHEFVIATMKHIGERRKILLLIDGLDECNEDSDEQDELVELLTTLSHFTFIKIIISSRPENIFQDAFREHPSLCLEDLTRIDIQTYVVSQLRKYRPWNLLEREEPAASQFMIGDIIERAEGVFLWVVLTVRGIIRSLRDGDDVKEIQFKLSQIPADLNGYFRRIIESIDPSYRREASVLLQLALYHEKRFLRLRPLCLADTFFTGELNDNFVLRPDFDFESIDFSKQEAMQMKLESTFRRINSRCKGLLQCVGDLNAASYDNKNVRRSASLTGPSRNGQSLYSQAASATVIDQAESMILGVSVVLLHRSLREFLLLPQQQQILHSYTGGNAIDARRHLYDARLVHLLALDRIGYWSHLMLRLASGILSAFSVNHKSADTARKASLVRDCMERLATFPQASEESDYYISESFERWHEEQSNFLTLTIDFHLTSYISGNLTAASVRNKRGRPILDYVLRPRFFCYDSDCCFYRVVDPHLVRAVLACRADPNQPYNDVSVWALYICFLADFALVRRNQDLPIGHAEQLACLETLQVLVNAKSALTLPISWLSGPGLAENSASQDIFARRWPKFTSNERNAARLSGQICHNPTITVSDLLMDFDWLSPWASSELTKILRSSDLENNAA